MPIQRATESRVKKASSPGLGARPYEHDSAGWPTTAAGLQRTRQSTGMGNVLGHWRIRETKIIDARFHKKATAELGRQNLRCCHQGFEKGHTFLIDQHMSFNIPALTSFCEVPSRHLSGFQPR